MNRAIHPWGSCAVLTRKSPLCVCVCARARARSTLIRLKIYHRQYYAFNQRCRICECYWYNGPYFSRMGGDFSAAPKAQKCQKWHLAESQIKKAIWNFRVDLQPHKSWSFYTKMDQSNKRFLCGNCCKRMAQMSWIWTRYVFLVVVSNLQRNLKNFENLPIFYPKTAIFYVFRVAISVPLFLRKT